MYPQNYYYPIKEKCDSGTCLVGDEHNNFMLVGNEITSINGRVINKSVFGHGCIKKVKHRIFSKEYESSDEYVFTVQTAKDKSQIRDVYIPKKEYGKPAMVNKLVEDGGLYFNGKHSDTKRASMIVNEVAFNFTLEKEYIYYLSGFYEGKFIYRTDLNNEYHVDAPVDKNILMVGNAEANISEDFEDLFEIMKKYDDPNMMILLLYIVYGLCYTIFSDLGYKSNKILALCGKGADSAAEFMQIYCKGIENRTIALNNNITTLKKHIFNSKDEVLIFKGSEKKLKDLCEIFCQNNCPEIKINGKAFKLTPKSVCAVISDSICEYVPADYVKEVSFETKVPTLEANAFGRIIEYIMHDIEKKYMEGFFETNINDYIEQEEERFSDEEINEYAIYMTAYKIIHEMFDKFSLDANEILQEEPEKFFGDFVMDQSLLTDEETLLEKVKASFIGNILDDAELIKYNGKKIKIHMPDDRLLLLYDDKCIYIHYDHFNKFILSKFSEGMSAKKLLRIMYEQNLLYGNNSGRTVRLSVQLEGNMSERSDWIAITRSFFEIEYALPILPGAETICGNSIPILLGLDKLGRNINLPLSSGYVNNNHIGIVGDSGTGKTYLTMNIIKELSKNNIPTVIIDTAESFRRDLLDKDFIKVMDGKLDYISVYKNRLPLNIFNRQKIFVDGEYVVEKDSDLAMRCSQILARSCGLSPLQATNLYEVIVGLLEVRCGVLITIDDLYDELVKCGMNIETTKIFPIKAADVFRNDGSSMNWGNILEQGKCTIFSLSGYQDDSIKRMIAECILQDKWNYAQQCGDKESPFAVVVDEIGNTPPKRKSAIADMLHLGRKFGVMCVWNTQFLKSKFKDEEIAYLEQSSTMAYFRMSDIDEKKYAAKKLCYDEGCADVLDTLRKGECVVQGTFCTEGNKLVENTALYTKIPRI